MKSFFTCLYLSFCLQRILIAQLTVDLPMAEHAILQRNKATTLQGMASMSTSVYVSIDDHRYEATTDLNGKWHINLPAKNAGGPHKVIISDGRHTIKFEDIWYGDVWLASGQSNMEWPVDKSDNNFIEKLDASYPLIREFYIDHEISLSPKERLTKGSWIKANQETVGKFSATAFFFARKIWKETNIPIGIIHSSWGGSQAESWISLDAMNKSEHLNDYAKSYKPNWVVLDNILERQIAHYYTGENYRIPTATDEKKYITDPSLMLARPTTWPMGSWDWKGAWAFRGAAYLATNADILAGVASQTTELSIGSCNCQIIVYINGKEVVNENGQEKRSFFLPPNTWGVGKNYLLIKIGMPLNDGWKEVGIQGNEDALHIKVGDYIIPLAKNTWHHTPAFGDDHYYEHMMNNAGTIIYNAMIAPIVHYPIKGVIWYQGESNAKRATEYDKTMQLLIKSWREKWGIDMPFYFVELSSFGSRQSSNQGSLWAELRESQKKTDDLLPYTERVTTIDIGNAHDIHPTNKQDVGHRLAGFALKNDYQKMTVDPSFPVIINASFKKNKVILTANSFGGNWIVKDDYNYIRGFEIKDKNGKWHFAQASIDKKQRIVINHQNSISISAVRYAWADAPIEANLFGNNGLPLRPYRSDNDKNITDGITFFKEN